MRYILIVFCLVSLAFAGPVNAACATDLGGSFDSSSTMHSISARKADCDMGRNKVHKCAHDPCCGNQVIAISAIGDFSTLPAPRPAAIASVAKPLATSGWKPLLDPPRA